ncbi:hypothetical protein [Bradyrhizobium prioriisuperbiae]|uniref:hypothetical protein n=1 Tax=Bradyrhizobium prioriisuperbiae TaxID=2854389 RepID=UPI0028ED028F|nr:hypothetical protein [Bradyrhizobium prioritasuperba]
MTDTDTNKLYVDARASLRDTAKWIVTILGATVVVVIGGGLIAKIADLDTLPRVAAACCLLLLTLFCLIPLRSAVDIVASSLTPLGTMALSQDYDDARTIVNGWLAGHYPPGIDTIETLYGEYLDQTAIVNNPAKSDQQRTDAAGVLGELQPRIREVIEITNTEHLRLKFDRMVRATSYALPIIGLSLFAFLTLSHKDDATEKALKKPSLLQIAWSGDVEEVLKKAGMPSSCYMSTPPKWIQLSEMSGLRAGVLVVPRDLGTGCPAVRVIVTNANQVIPFD